MKAIVQVGYGSADVLKLEEIETPSIGDGQVLIEVYAASVNALDWHLTRGKPYFMRLIGGLRAPRDRVRGVDVAGIAQAVGKGVERIKVGNHVFGGCDGSFAEYAATREHRLAVKPDGLSWEQAATLNVAGLTALQGLRDRAQLARGQSLLVVGAGGGVGTFAVQIGKWLGARVTAVTRADRIELVRSIGADDVVDHGTYDPVFKEKFDVVFDISGTRPLTEYRRVMTPGGILVAVGGPAGPWLAPADRLLKAAALSPFTKQRFTPFVAKAKHEDLALLAELVQSGVIVPVIDQTWPLLAAASAVGRVGSGQARGKVVVRVRADEAN
ncbi:MAG: NAD(P)-dependent alcohol dehydrogenase [Thermoanaerobaculia bacterium]